MRTVACRLMRSTLLVLAMPRCRDASRNATLNVVESLIDLEGGLGYNILMGHVDQLLESLRLIALTAWSTPVSKEAYSSCIPHALPYVAFCSNLHTLYAYGRAASSFLFFMHPAVALP